MKFAKKELEALVLEELKDIDEGVWQRLKGIAGGVGGALSGLTGGGMKKGYQRGKTSSLLKSLATDLISVKDKFVENVEALYKEPFSDIITIDAGMEDIVTAWNEAIDKIEDLSKEFQELSMKVKIIPDIGGTTSPSIVTQTSDPRRGQNIEDIEDTE